MIDLVGLPTPAGNPEPGSCARIERPEDGLAVLRIDPPHRPKIAVFDVPLLRDLDRLVEELEALAASGDLRGLVLTGRAPTSFAAGADIETIAGISDPVLAKRFVREGQRLLQRIFRLGRSGGGKVRTVAAVGGPVPGGAYELALTCDRIVLAEHAKTRVGLPEVRLGIFPAWGGTTRLPRRVGVPAALGAILTGKLYRARAAYRLGMVDRLTKPEYLLRIAGDVALGRTRCPYRGRRGLAKLLVDRNPLAGAFVAHQARKGVMAQTKGRYPAPLAVLPLVVRAPRRSLDAGLEAEVEAVLPLTASPVAAALLGLFLQSEEAKKLARLPGAESDAAGFSRAAVIGAGVMGGAIASLMAEKGMSVRLRDLDRGQLDAAVIEHQRAIGKKRRRRRLPNQDADAALDRLEATTEAVGFGRCEIAIEAVAEKIEVKRAVFRELAELLPADAILATNTSSLSVGEIADSVPAPERVVGMHFFNPVRVMPLVEIVRGPQTSDEVVARTAKLAIALGKTPVVTADVAGFLVNRVLGPYLDEAVRLVEGGMDPATIDAALERFGMQMGPCTVIDEVGLDIASHAGATLASAYDERMRTSDYLAPLVEAGQLGKKSGAGLYVWNKGRRGARNPKLGSRSGATPREEDVVDRLVLAMVNEAARCLADEVVAGPRELDLAMVFGTGFAPFRGGPLQYADARGAAEIVERLRELREAPDIAAGAGGAGPDRAARFEPAPLLVELAAGGSRFHG